VENKEEFKKFDNNKIDMGLIPPILLEAYARIGTYGSQKYGKFNYRKAELKDIPRYHAAFLRHYFGYTDSVGSCGFLQGNIKDHESGLNELHQALWNLVSIIEASEKFGYLEVSKAIRGLE